MNSIVRPGSHHGASHFTLRALAVGLLIGVLNCICNAYFILQAGWGTDLSMSSSVIGFAIFKEPFDTVRLIAFLMIWSALVIYTLPSLMRSRAAG